MQGSEDTQKKQLERQRELLTDDLHQYIRSRITFGFYAEAERQIPGGSSSLPFKDRPTVRSFENARYFLDKTLKEHDSSLSEHDSDAPAPTDAIRIFNLELAKYARFVQERLQDKTLYTTLTDTPDRYIMGGDFSGGVGSHNYRDDIAAIITKIDEEYQEKMQGEGVYPPVVMKQSLKRFFKLDRMTHFRSYQDETDLVSDTVAATVQINADMVLLKQKDSNLSTRLQVLMEELEHKNLDLKEAAEVLEGLNALDVDLNLKHTFTETIAIQLSENALNIENLEYAKELETQMQAASSRHINSAIVELRLLEQLGAEDYQKIKILHTSGLEVPLLRKGAAESLIKKKGHMIGDFAKAIKSDLEGLNLKDLQEHRATLPRIIRREVDPNNALFRKINDLVDKVKKFFKIKQSSSAVMASDVKKIIRSAKGHEEAVKNQAPRRRPQ